MICTKCKMRYVEKHFAPLCYICGLKAKGFYKSAKKQIGGWFDWSTKMIFEPGWSLKQQLCFVGALIAVLKSLNLNKAAKVNVTLYDYFPKYWVDKFGG